MNRRYMAGPPKPYRRTKRALWWLLIGVLVVAIAVAWCAVPEPDLIAAGWR
jgi:hypothetical protein